MSEEIRVVLFGKTGVGKSMLGNNILDQQLFSAKASAQSVTKQTKRGERMIDDACKLILVDTPGLFDTATTDNLETAKILASTVKETKPGPHIFIFVLSIERFTPEERATVEFLKDLFGSHVTDYLIIVFTRKDDLDYEEKDLKTYLDEADDELKSIVSQCKDVMAINNRAPDIKESVDSLVKMIQDVYLKNNKQYYRDELLVKAQKLFDEKLRLQEEEACIKERELEAKLKEQRLKHDEISAKQKEEMEKHKSKNIQLDSQLKEVRKQNRKFEKDKTDETKKLREANNELMSDLESKKNQNELELQRMIEVYDDQLQIKKAEIEKLEEEIKQKKNEIQERRTQKYNIITYYRHQINKIKDKSTGTCIIL